MTELPKRKNHRLEDFDYSSYGYYFVTLCTYQKMKLLSQVSDGTVTLTDIGKQAETCWRNMAKLNSNVDIDSFIIMPNHIHGIIILRNQGELSGNNKYSFQITENKQHRSLQGLVRDFKSVTTRLYKKQSHVSHSLWQDSFYDEVIKGEKHYLSVLNYIQQNPQKWELDRYF